MEHRGRYRRGQTRGSRVRGEAGGAHGACGKAVAGSCRGLWRAVRGCGGLAPLAGRVAARSVWPRFRAPRSPASLGKSLLGDYLTYGTGRNPEVCVQRKEASGSRDLAEGEP